MKKIAQISLVVFGVAIIILIVGLIMQQLIIWHIAALIAAIFLAIGLGAIPQLKGFQYLLLGL